MAFRALNSFLLGQHCTPMKGMIKTSRQFTTSPRLMTEGAKSGGVRGPGTAAPSEGVKDMNIADRETVTEASESPRDVAETMKHHQDAGKSSDSEAQTLKGKPVDKSDAPESWEDLMDELGRFVARPGWLRCNQDRLDTWTSWSMCDSLFGKTQEDIEEA